MKNILAIDTTTNILKIGLQYNQKRITTNLDKGFYHIENLLPTIDELIKKLNVKKTDLDYIAVCTGPGSFTGMRIGIATARGIAFALGIKIFGFSVFDIYNFLYKSNETNIFIPLLDAKKNRFYCSFILDSHKQIYDLSANEIALHIKKHYSNKKIFLGGNSVELFLSKLTDELEYEISNIKDYGPESILDYCISFLSTNNELPTTNPIYIRKSEAELALLKKKGTY